MLITNFSSGEISENLKGRVDLAIYSQSCNRLENFDVIPTGGITRRIGTERIAQLDNNCRIIPFIINKDLSFILEFSNGIIKIWKNGKKLLDENNEQIYLTTFYTSLAEIKNLQYTQNYNEMIFVHENYRPYKIIYNFDTETFTFGVMGFDFYADVQLDDDFNYIKIADNKGLPEADYDGQYCLYLSKLYKWNEENQKWEIDGTDEEIEADLFTQETKYPSCVAFYNNRLWFASTKQARQKIWASNAPDTKGNRYNEFSTFKKFITVNKVVKDADVHIFTGQIDNADEDITVITNVSQDLTDKLLKDKTEYYIFNTDYFSIGTKVIDVTSNSIKVQGKALTTGEAITFTIQLWKNPNTPDAEDYEFQVVNQNMVTSDCSFNFEIASEQNDAIKWLASNKYLVIGTESSTWVCPTSITALTIITEMNGRYGTDEIQAQCIDTAIIYFSQGNKGIREYYYNNQFQAFQTNNIAILAEQMLEESPVIDFDFITNPYNEILITRDDGQLVTLLYDKNNGVMAWKRAILGNNNKIRSVATTRGDDFCDIIYLVVEDNGSYFLEKLDKTKQIYIDSWKEYKAEIGNTDLYSENAVIYNETTEKIFELKNGIIPDDFYTPGDKAYIGYLYNSKIVSLPIISNDIMGKKRIVSLQVRVNNSYLPSIIVADKPKEKLYAETEPFSGITETPYPSVSNRDINFTLEYNSVKNCKILSVNAVVGD